MKSHVLASSRYAAPRKAVRLHPSCHEWLGLGLVIGGFTVILLNVLMDSGNDLTLLPDGDSQLYLLLGPAIASSSMWWFGWFDGEQ